MGRVNLGEFEQLVLLACLRLEDEAYTVAVLEELEAAGRSASHAAVYIALKRLEERGLVAARQGGPGEGRSGRPRRIFTVRPEAHRLLSEYRDTYLTMWQGVEIPGGAR